MVSIFRRFTVKRRRITVALWLCFGIVVFLLLLFALRCYPLPIGDSVVFLPPALYMGEGRAFINPYYTALQFLIPDTYMLFSYYPPGFPWLLGVINKVHPGIHTIFLTCFCFSGINLFLFTKQAAATLQREPERRWLTMLTFACVPFLGVYLLPTCGRPEVLSSLLISLLYTLYVYQERFPLWVNRIGAAILLAALCCTQIVGGYFATLLYAIAVLIRERSLGKALPRLAITAFLCLVFTLIILALSPYGLVSTVKGILLHAHYVEGRSDRSLKLISFYWITYPMFPGFAFLFLAAVWMGIQQLMWVYTTVDTGTRVTGALLLALLCYGLVRFVLYAGPTVYNVTQFEVVLCLYTINRLGRRISINSFLHPSTILMLTAALAGLVSLSRWTYLFADSERTRRDYHSAKAQLNLLHLKYPHILVPNAFWTLIEPIDSLKPAWPGAGKKGDIMVLEQANQDMQKALPVGCKIVLDWRTPKRPTFLQIPLSNNVQNYGFVAYEVQ